MFLASKPFKPLSVTGVKNLDEQSRTDVLRPNGCRQGLEDIKLRPLDTESVFPDM